MQERKKAFDELPISTQNKREESLQGIYIKKGLFSFLSLSSFFSLHFSSHSSCP